MKVAVTEAFHAQDVEVFLNHHLKDNLIIVERYQIIPLATAVSTGSTQKPIREKGSVLVIVEYSERPEKAAYSVKESTHI